MTAGTTVRLMTGPLVIGGVSGTGKTTIGREVAHRLGRPFLDADGLHTGSAVAKMACGTPLTDKDRWPWLDAVAAWLVAYPDGVCACSALNRAYRDRLRSGAPGVRVIMLAASAKLLRERLIARRGHFMPTALLDSQLSTEEPVARGEAAERVDAEGTIEEVVAAVLAVATAY